MRCKNSEHAQEAAQANANVSGRYWVYFADTSGNWCAEPASAHDLANLMQTWAGAVRTVVEPHRAIKPTGEST